MGTADQARRALGRWRRCGNCLDPARGIHAIDCPRNPRYQAPLPTAADWLLGVAVCVIGLGLMLTALAASGRPGVAPWSALVIAYACASVAPLLWAYLAGYPRWPVVARWSLLALLGVFPAVVVAWLTDARAGASVPGWRGAGASSGPPRMCSAHMTTDCPVCAESPADRPDWLMVAMVDLDAALKRLETIAYTRGYAQADAAARAMTDIESALMALAQIAGEAGDSRPGPAIP